MWNRKVLLILFAVLFVQPVPMWADESIEYKLASVDAGHPVASHDITVARFRSLLEQLSTKYVEDKGKMAGMTVKAQQLLREQGVNEKMLNIMEGMNKIFSQPFPNQKCAEYVSFYIQFRTKGQSHDEAVNGLRTLLRTLGIP
jgi:hypothetical protein